MRGFVIASSNMFSYIHQIWWTDAVWRTQDAPRFKDGFTGAAAAGGALALCCLLVRWLEVRDGKRRLREVVGPGDVEAPIIAPLAAGGEKIE